MPIANHPLKGARAALEYYRQIHANWTRRHHAFGDGYNTAIIRLVLIGYMESKPFDISALAENVPLSRQQVARRVVLLKADGWLDTDRRTTHLNILPTMQLLDHTLRDLHATFARIRTHGEKLFRLMDEHPLPPRSEIAPKPINGLTGRVGRQHNAIKR